MGGRHTPIPLQFDAHGLKITSISLSEPSLEVFSGEEDFYLVQYTWSRPMIAQMIIRAVILHDIAPDYAFLTSFPNH